MSLLCRYMLSCDLNNLYLRLLVSRHVYYVIRIEMFSRDEVLNSSDFLFTFIFQGFFDSFPIKDNISTRSLETGKSSPPSLSQLKSCCSTTTLRIVHDMNRRRTADSC